MNFKKTLSLLFLLLPGVLALQAQSLNKAKLDSLMDAISASNKGMGSLALSYNGQTIYQRAIGYADVAKKQQANVSTKYRIGSISKMFTGVMIFQLIEEGKLTLTTPLSKFYPQFPNATAITVGLLLQHRSGLHNFTNDPDFLNYLEQHKTEQEMLAIMVKPKPDFAPDTKGQYSNTNFVLLGYIVEKLTKKSYAAAVKERIVAKAGLTNTYYGGKINTAVNEAQSYKFEGDTWKPETETDMSIPAGAGAMVSTPAALDKFVEALFAGKLISKAHLFMMQTIKDGYGMAMFMTPAIGKKGYGHTGGIDGFHSQVIYFPDDKFSIAYISNAETDVMGDILMGAMNIYFGKPYAIPNFNLKIDPADLDKYLGVYSSPGVPLKFTITKANAELYAQATGQSAFPLKLTAPNVFEFASAGIVIEFEPANKRFTIKQGGRNTVFTKDDDHTAGNTVYTVKPADLDKYVGVYAALGVLLKITVAKQEAALTAQATGQGAFPLNPTALHTFDFKQAGIEIKFDPQKSEMALKQGPSTTIFTKEK